MTALKLNRFNLSEIDTVTIHCKQCGSGHIVNIRGGRYSVSVCPSCEKPYGAQVKTVLYSLQEACQALESVKQNVDVEFDIIDK